MRRLHTALILFLLLSAPHPFHSSEGKAAETSAQIKALFADPPRQFSSGPLWTWNDLLTEDQIRDTLNDLAQQKVKQVWVHPRPGLMTPYLDDDWFRLWKVALKEAERLDMNVWIYDENSYPSGFAGGLVPEAMPEARGKGLHFAEVKQLGKLGDDVMCVFRLTDDGYEDVTAKAKADEPLPEGRYLVGTIRLAPTSNWFGGKFYVDLLKPGVTQKFLEITMGAYEHQPEIARQFGRRVPGVFTDEPHLCPAGGLHWGDYLEAEFQRRWGYSLRDNLPCLVRPVGDWRRVRHNYFNLLLELFIDRWAKPFHEYCEKHNLEFTGHYWEHGWPGASHGGDNMAMYAWHQRPSIDNLMNQYSEDVHGQFGNSRTVKELSSVANQLGRKRTLCETYGAGGWDLRFEDMKRIGDWLYVLGVNTLNEHLSYVTIRGTRKRDHPQSFSYHEPWWQSYHVMARYFTRLSLALSAGHQVNHVLVIEPTSTAWMYQPDSSGRQRLDEIGNSFQDLINALERAQAEYDVGCEDIMARHGGVRELRTVDLDRGPLELLVGNCNYHTVVLPPHTENLNSAVMDLVEEFALRGGDVLCCGPPPTYVDGQPSPRGAKLAEQPGFKRLSAEALPAELLKRTATDLRINRDKDDQGILFHHRRRLDNGEILLLVNTSIEHSSSGTIESNKSGIERWDPATGETSPYPFIDKPEGVKTGYRLPPCGSLLLFLSDTPIEPAAPRAAAPQDIQPVGQPTIRRVEPNVLTIDYVDVTAGGETKTGQYCYNAAQFAFQQNGMEHNPWDHAVQFRDEFIARKFPADSGFEATYRFTIEGAVPKPLHLVVERPDLYTITVNGKPVSAIPDAWWLDKAFGKIDVSNIAKRGENVVTLKASPFTVFHEIEPVYVLGEFALKPVEQGFVIASGKPLKLGPWNAQGHPFYAAGVAYTQTFNVSEPKGRFVVSLPDWYGSVARVTVNGKPAGEIAWQPWQRDVTDLIRPGENTVEVTVIGTLKNTLGPHHGDRTLGRAWPWHFRQGPEPGPPPGSQYHNVQYGLFQPFALKQISSGTNVHFRGSLDNSRTEFEKQGKGHVAFIGGSITEMNGYRPMVCEILKRRFPHTEFTFTDAGISSTCSTTGAFRLESDVLSKGPVDLFFIEFAVNDDQDAGHARRECIRGMEGIIRHVRRHNPAADIVVTYFVNPPMLETLQSGGTPLTSDSHGEVARHYQVSTIDLAREVAEQITAGKLTWEQFGGTHPAPRGNAICAGMIDRLMDRAWRKPLADDAQKKPHWMLEPLDPLHYGNGRFIAPDQAKIAQGWRIEVPDWKSLKGNCRGRFVETPMLCAEEPGAELTLEFTGTAVGAYLLAGPDAGIVEASVDGGPPKSIDTLHHYSANLHYPRTVMFATDLPPGKHTLRLRVSDKTSGAGHAVRIMQFVAN